MIKIFKTLKENIVFVGAFAAFYINFIGTAIVSKFCGLTFLPSSISSHSIIMYGAIGFFMFVVQLCWVVYLIILPLMKRAESFLSDEGRQLVFVVIAIVVMMANLIVCLKGVDYLFQHIDIQDRMESCLLF